MNKNDCDITIAIGDNFIYEKEVIAFGIVVTFPNPVSGFRASDIQVKIGEITEISGDGKVFYITTEVRNKTDSIDVFIPKDVVEEGNSEAHARFVLPSFVYP